MSRRLRKEQEREQQIKEDEAYVLDKLKLMKERMYAPIVWKRMATGFRIEDIKEKHFQEVLDVIKVPFFPDKRRLRARQEHYLEEDVLCRNSEMRKDEVSTQSFLERCHFQLMDTTSIMAVDESNLCPILENTTKSQVDVPETEEVAGVVLLRIIFKEDFGRVFSRSLVVRGEAQQKCIEIKSALNRKVDLYEKFDCESYMRIYAVCIKPKYRRKGIGFNMMSCAVNVARSMHIPVIMGIFDNCTLQKCGKRLGMEAMAEINYVDWLDKNKNLVFDDPGPGNYTCALYAGRVPQEPPPEKPKPQVAVATEEKKKKSKNTRQERKEAAKKKKQAG